MSSSNYWDKRAIQRLNEAEMISDTHISQIKNIYNQAFHNIEKQLNNIYQNYSKETGIDIQTLKVMLSKSETNLFWKQLTKMGLNKYVKNNYKSRISRLEQIQAQIYAEAKKIYQKEQLEQQMCYKGVVNHSYYKAVYDTQRGIGYDFTFNKIDTNLLDRVLNERWSGKNYSERIWGNTDILADSVSQIIGGALLSGQGIEKTTRQVRDRFGIAKSYAERLVRTETNHFNNEADAIAYEEMGINEYVFVATLDGRTSKICQSQDGKRYKYSEKKTGVNFPPLHPNCRSKTRGYLGAEVEKQLKRRARNPITGKTELIDNISYEEWIKKTMSIENSPNMTYNNSKLLGTGKVYKPNYSKIIGEHSIEIDLSKVNPNFDTHDPKWYRNCQRCVPTYEMRRRGFNVEAKPKLQSDIIAKKPQIVFQDAEIRQFTRNAEETVRKAMQEWGDGARCQICVYWDTQGGHTFIAEQRNGKTVFLDPQTNDINVEKYFKEIKVTRSYFYRIDNLEVTDYIKDCCEEAKHDIRRSDKTR